jgi:hypothetical protein
VELPGEDGVVGYAAQKRRGGRPELRGEGRCRLALGARAKKRNEGRGERGQAGEGVEKDSVIGIVAVLAGVQDEDLVERAGQRDGPLLVSEEVRGGERRHGNELVEALWVEAGHIPACGGGHSMCNSCQAIKRVEERFWRTFSELVCRRLGRVWGGSLRW